MTLHTPSLLKAGSGTSYWITTAQLTVKFSGADTGGAYSLIELSAPEGMAIAPHTHMAEDETFVVVSGSLRLFCETESFDLEPGDCAFLPRGRKHWFQVTSEDFRALEIVSPGGFETMLEDMGEVASRPRTFASYTPDDMQRVLEVTRRHGHILSMPTGAGPAAPPHQRVGHERVDEGSA